MAQLTPHSPHIITLAETSQEDAVAAEVVQCLQHDGVAVLPTETVYGICAQAGLGASGEVREDADVSVCPAAQRIYAIKERPHSLPLPLLVADTSWLKTLAPQTPTYALELAQAFWPGALTLIVRVTPEAARSFGTSVDQTIGIRCPQYPFVKAVLDKLGTPLFATSANTHGNPSPLAAGQLEIALCNQADIIVDGGTCAVGTASTVVLCTGDRPLIVRSGEITQEDIERALL